MTRRTFGREATRPSTYFSHSLTITSESGVGSTTLLKRLLLTWGMPYRFVSGGSLMRARAAAAKMSMEEYAAYLRHHPELGIDVELDREIARFGLQNWVVVESRLGHVFVPRAFHVRLTCPLDVRAERRQRDCPEMALDDVRQLIDKRDQDDNERYEELYPGCLWPPEHFDLVVNTSTSAPLAIAERITQAMNQWREEAPTTTEIFLASDMETPLVI